MDDTNKYTLEPNGVLDFSFKHSSHNNSQNTQYLKKEDQESNSSFPNLPNKEIMNFPNVYQALNSSNYNIHPIYEPNIPLSVKNVEHVVRVLPPNDRRYLDSYAYVKCPNVTTFWISSYGFSYLTSYSNDGNYFFLPRSDNGFGLSTWNESLTDNKVSREKMTEFIFELNNQFSISSIIKQARSEWNKKTRIIHCVTFVSFIIFLFDSFYWYTTTELNYFIVSIIIWILAIFVFFVSSVASCVYYCVGNENQGSINNSIIESTVGFENFLNTWNSKYFIPNGLYVIAPRNLIYLQFVLDSKIKFSLENHSYPYDLVPYRGGRLSV
jgi:hypothetical protein